MSHDSAPSAAPAAKARADGATTEEILALMLRLFPICRSITGNGVRETLGILSELIPLEIHEVPSGTKAFDWIVPREWNIRDAWIKNSRGERVVDFRKSNLHVLGYSVPVRKNVSLTELKQHLFTLPEHPDWIPYRTSYYSENWGFCLSHNQLLALNDEQYEICVDSTLNEGSLTYGELLLQGETDEEVLISTHVCHPSLANDNVAGLAIAAFLARDLSRRACRYSYRFLFTPGTIGSIVWLSRNQEEVSRIRHGLVLACLADSGRSTYKKSRRGNAEIDRAVVQVLRDSGTPFNVQEFSPYGYDERQFCSPGFNLPVGCFMRTPYGQYSEYHTSADNLGLIDPLALSDSFQKCFAIFDLLEKNRRYLNQCSKCEPQLGRRGLYGSVGGATNTKTWEMALLWVLNLSDGCSSLLDIAERSGMDFDIIRRAAERLRDSDLLTTA